MQTKSGIYSHPMSRYKSSLVSHPILFARKDSFRSDRVYKSDSESEIYFTGSTFDLHQKDSG